MANNLSPNDEYSIINKYEYKLSNEEVKDTVEQLFKNFDQTKFNTVFDWEQYKKIESLHKNDENFIIKLNNFLKKNNFLDLNISTHVINFKYTITKLFSLYNWENKIKDLYDIFLHKNSIIYLLLFFTSILFLILIFF